MLLHYLGKQESGNPKIASFHLNDACCFTKNRWNTLKDIIWSQTIHPSPSKRSSECTRQDLGSEHSILQYVTLTLDVYQVCHCVGHCVKNGGCSSSCMESKSMDSIAGISYYLNKCETLWTCRLWQFALSARQCTSTSCVKQSNCCSAKLSAPFLLTYGSVTVQSLTPLTATFRKS